MTRCPEPTEWVLLATGEAPPDRRARLEEHLATCPACRAHFENLCRGWEALAALEPVPLRAAFLADLRARLAAASARRRRRRRWRAVAVAVVVAAGVVLAVLLAPEPTGPAPADWLEEDRFDVELVEITANLELLETDTFAAAWIPVGSPPEAQSAEPRPATPDTKGVGRRNPAGQSRAPEPHGPGALPLRPVRNG